MSLIRFKKILGRIWIQSVSGPNLVFAPKCRTTVQSLFSEISEIIIFSRKENSRSFFLFPEIAHCVNFVSAESLAASILQKWGGVERVRNVFEIRRYFSKIAGNSADIAVDL